MTSLVIVRYDKQHEVFLLLDSNLYIHIIQNEDNPNHMTKEDDNTELVGYLLNIDSNKKEFCKVEVHTTL